MKLFSLLLIAFLFLQALVEAKSVSDAKHSRIQEDAGENTESQLKKQHRRGINCSYACSSRCRKSSRKNVCHRACKSCCARCHCELPPGTYGNKDLCPCYASLRTHGNKPKCP